MQQQLNQLTNNGRTQLQNLRDQAFPVEELAQFSKTLTGLLDEKVEDMKSNLQSEVAYDVFMEGIGPTEEFEKQEQALKTGSAPVDKNAGVYEKQTGDVEGAESIRNMTGWRGYYYKQAKAEQHGNNFGAFMNANAENPEYSVNGFTLASATDAATRQAVVAKMASNYMSPYKGLNKSFLAKYMFPGMRKGMAATTAKYAAKSAELVKANRLDAAKQAFFTSSDKGAAMQNFRAELTAMGYSEAEIRGEMVKIAGTFSNKSQLDAFLDSQYGPNGKTFREQYPREAQEATDSFYRLKNAEANNNAKERAIEDQIELEKAMAAVAEDAKDGRLDANPETLRKFQQESEAKGHTKTAKYWESKIAETAYMRNSVDVKNQYEAQIQAGIIPQESEILQNLALSKEHKQELLKQISSSGKSKPPAATAESHEKEIEDAIKKRGKFLPMQANDPSIKAMAAQAWQQYISDYNAELKRNGGDSSSAALLALNNFKKEFANQDGQYRLITPEDVAQDPRLKPYLGTYAGYDRFGETAPRTSPMDEIRSKTQGPQAFMSIQEALEAPDLYAGEDVQLEALSRSFAINGVVGNIPPVYYELQQQLGGKVSIMDLVNKRLEANGLDPLPEELNNIVKPVEDIFDEESYAHINYKPNTTRTDIGMISSGQDPIYSQKIPTPVADDIEFQQGVTGMSQRLGVNEGDMYAVMSFETGGTFDPGIANAAGSGATGLIQFMPSTARGLGTTTEALARMSRTEQLQYVERYLVNAGVKPGASLSDLYMAVLFPAAVGKSDDFVLFGNGAMSGYTGVAYQQNRGLDSNGDGSITKAEASAKVLRHRKPAQPWRQPVNMRTEL